jgi:hypothetical protein
MRALGLAYPIGTLIVIVGTANHFVLDAVGGAAIVAIAFGLQWVLSGHGAYVAPVDAPDFAPPDPEVPGLHERPVRDAS